MFQYKHFFQAKDSVSNKTTYYFHNVTVEDTDEPPVCNKTVPEGPLEIMSNHTPGNIIFKVLCTDPDITPSFKIQSYEISTGKAESLACNQYMTFLALDILI